MADDADNGDDEIEAIEIARLKSKVLESNARAALAYAQANDILERRKTRYECLLGHDGHSGDMPEAATAGIDIQKKIAAIFEATDAEMKSLVSEFRALESSTLDLVRSQIKPAPARIESATLATLDVQSPSQVVLAAGIVSAAALIIAGHPSYGLCFLAVGPALALLPYLTRHFPDLLKDSSSRG